jgi:AcrR family transcriptional regulator
MEAMTIKELAQELGVSHQAVYKRLTKNGIRLDSLKNPSTGEITPDGEKTIRDMYAPQQNAETSTAEAKHQVSTGSPEAVAEVEKELHELKNKLNELNGELNALRHDLTDARHRAELAEMRATAAEGERDFLRAQLDNAIKANALASMKRLAPPEDSQKGLVRRVADAWANMWARRDKTAEAPAEDE